MAYYDMYLSSCMFCRLKPMQNQCITIPSLHVSSTLSGVMIMVAAGGNMVILV